MLASHTEIVDCQEWCHWCQGDYWHSRRQAEKDARPPWCERCGISRKQHKRLYGFDLDLHHLTYDRRNYELSSDFQMICRRCHDLEHKRPAQVARWKDKPHAERPKYHWLVMTPGWKRLWEDRKREIAYQRNYKKNPLMQVPAFRALCKPSHEARKRVARAKLFGLTSRYLLGRPRPEPSSFRPLLGNIKLEGPIEFYYSPRRK